MEPDERARRWELVAGHRDRLLPLALARTASRADAEDAVHEAMLRAVTYPDLDETRLRSFLTAVTVRLCVDQHRHRQRELRSGTAVFHGECEDGDPEPAACDRAEAAWAATVLAALPERQREVVAVRAGGADLAETAQRLHLSYKAVESALSRARTQVRAAMAAGASVVVALGRRSRDAAVPATAMTALSLTAAVVVGGAVPTPPAAAPLPATTYPRGTSAARAGVAPGQSGQAGQVAAGAAAAAAVRSGGGRGGGPAFRAPAPRPRDPRPERVVYVPGPADGVEVTVHDTEETTAQMVERCATGGYTLENNSGRCTKQEGDPGAYPVSDVIDDVVPVTEGAS